MYFVKEFKRNRKLSTDETAYFYFAECSKGQMWLTPSYLIDKLTKEKTKRWQWRVSRWVYTTDKSNNSVKTIIKTVSCFASVEVSLYKATKAGLQCLLSQRRQPLPQLMNMLAQDQVMYELSKIGG